MSPEQEALCADLIGRVYDNIGLDYRVDVVEEDACRYWETGCGRVELYGTLSFYDPQSQTYLEAGTSYVRSGYDDFDVVTDFWRPSGDYSPWSLLADLSAGLATVASMVQILSLACATRSGNTGCLRLAGYAGGVAAYASGVELFAGVMDRDSGHVSSGSLGLSTLGLAPGGRYLDPALIVPWQQADAFERGAVVALYAFIWLVNYTISEGARALQFQLE